MVLNSSDLKGHKKITTSHRENYSQQCLGNTKTLRRKKLKLFRYKINRKGTWGKNTADAPYLPSPITIYYFPFTCSVRFNPSQHQTYEKKGLFNHWRIFGLSFWNTNVDAVIHGNHTSDKTKGRMIMSPESLQGKYKLKILFTEYFFLFCYCEVVLKS